MISFLSSLTIALAIVYPALASYHYIDPSCNSQVNAINAAYNEAGQAVTAAINALSLPDPPARVTNFLDVALGKPNPASDQTALKNLFNGKIHEAKELSKIAQPHSNDNGIALYCGDSIRWSFYVPDKSTPDCWKDFDPFAAPRVCAVKAPQSLNQNKGGLLYAPYPSTDNPKPQIYTPIESVPNEKTRREGNSVCANSETAGVTYLSPVKKDIVMIFCPVTFNPSASYVNTNVNQKYWSSNPFASTPAVAKIGAHLGSTTGIMIHELAHAQREGIDVPLSATKKAYEWSGVVALGEVNNGKAASANTAYKNCDTVQAFALAMLMSDNDWSSGKASKPK